MSCHLMSETTLPPCHKTFFFFVPHIQILRGWVKTFFFNCFHDLEGMGMMILREGDKAKQGRFLPSST